MRRAGRSDKQHLPKVAQPVEWLRWADRPVAAESIAAVQPRVAFLRLTCMTPGGSAARVGRGEPHMRGRFGGVVLAATSILTLSGCSFLLPLSVETEPTIEEFEPWDPGGLVAPQPPRFRGIWPEQFPEHLDRTDEALAEGHQPWRGEATLVADAYLREVLGRDDLDVGGGPAGPFDATVEYAHGPTDLHGVVRLARQREGGAWYVTALVPDGLDVGASRQGDALVLSIWSRFGGLAEVRAGGPASEWAASDVFEIPQGPDAEGATVRSELTMSGITPVLVELDLTDGEGRVHAVRLRVDA